MNQSIALRLAVAALAVAIPMTSVVGLNPTPTPTTGTVINITQATALSPIAMGMQVDAPQVVVPLIRTRWWGFEVRLTRMQTDLVLGVGSVAVQLTGLPSKVVVAVESALVAAGVAANDKGYCIGVNVPWPALLPGNQYLIQSADYKC